MTQVRCGRCQTQFTVQGPGRYPCPACGAVNEVRPHVDVPREPAAPVAASPRRTCPDCGFSFIVGDVEIAVCPNCGAQVGAGGDG
jgi:Zn finger protein HypA/HybF involved in hydrogenase expression